MADKPRLEIAERDILDIFPDHPIGREPPRKKKSRGWLRWVLLSLLVAVGGGASAWFVSFGGKEMLAGASNGPLPLIRADERPYKMHPVEPGGMEVPNRDKLVYERLRPGEAEPQVERLLPRTEAPHAPEKPPEKPAEPAPVAQAPQPQPSPQIEVKTETPPPVKLPLPESTKAEPAKTEPTRLEPPKSDPAKPEPVVPKVDSAKAAASAKPAAAKPPAATSSAAPPKAMGTGAFQIQLGALREMAIAEAEWAKLSKANSDLLGPFAHEIVTVEVAGKGTFYRLRAGPLADEAAARSLCQQLEARKVGCIVARK